MLLATVASDPAPRFCSPDGESCVVVRYPREAQRDAIDEWLDEYPSPRTEPETATEPVRGELYRNWPSGNQELLATFAFRPGEPRDRILVANGGSIVTYDQVDCGADSELLTIRARDGSIVRSLLVRDLFTKHDQLWLCRGKPDDVRWSIQGDRLRAAILVTDGGWDDAEARHETLDLDLGSAAVRRPERNRCPAAHLVEIETVHGNYGAFDADDVVTLASQTLLDRAVERVIPEYPELASRARIAGRVRVDVLVGRDGRVESARVSPLPFGIDAAVRAAIAQWTFAPDSTRVSGSFVFRFELVRPPRITTTSVSMGQPVHHRRS